MGHMDLIDCVTGIICRKKSVLNAWCLQMMTDELEQVEQQLQQSQAQAAELREAAAAAKPQVGGVCTMPVCCWLC